ncbi:hypothetical protein [Alkalicoccus daliensis]|uniref:Lipoprotein n=1 Tax=Alkalicoccus daliensis TaxID=745820 RepID=A0A1G9ZD79_9BACI|nr:hypothetical protein [Alkalicoccus daliensis]SDN19318.1 hypothetical protein SAMN04488053_10157 [Alkalicoccus daliensis]
MKKKFMLFSAAAVLLTGCSDWEEESTSIRFSHPDVDPYGETFRQLNLGYPMVLEYELRDPDNIMVELEASHYAEGELQEVVGSFGFYGGNEENSSMEGLLGLGILNPGEEGETFVTFADAGSVKSISETPRLLSEEEAAATWATAVEDEQTLELNIGEKEVIAIYRQIEGDSFSTYSLDAESVEEFLQEDPSVILLTAELIDNSSED